MSAVKSGGLPITQGKDDPMRQSAASQSTALPTLMKGQKNPPTSGGRTKIHTRGLSVTSQPLGFFGQGTTDDETGMLSPTEDDVKSNMSSQ